MNVMGAMAAGFTTEQVLNFILNSFPHVGQQIHAAKAAGKDIQQIMKFLEPMDTHQLKKMDQQIARSSNPLINSGRATKYNSASVQGPKYAMAAGGLALGAAGAYGLASMAGRAAAPAITSQLQLSGPAAAVGLPNLSTRGKPNIPGGAAPSPMAGGGGPQAPMAPSTGGMLQPQAPNPQMPVQAPTPQAQAPKVNAAEIFDTMGIKNHIDNMVQAGNPPEIIGGVIKSILHPQQKKFLETQTKEPLESLISDYISGKSSQPQMPAQTEVPQGAPVMPPNVPQNPSIASANTQLPDVEMPKEMPKIQGNLITIKKGDVVETPDGEGTVASKTKENALVDINGKVKKYKISDLKSAEKVHEVARSGKEAEQTTLKRRKFLEGLTYEKTYTGTPGQQHALKVIDRGVNKAAKFIAEGGQWGDLLPAPKGIQLSTAADVLRSLAGIPTNYKFLSEDDQQELFNTYQGLTPDLIWNTISLLEPEIQNLKELPINPKGKKKGKETMSRTELRRFVSHAVTKMVEKKKDFADHARMIVSGTDAIRMMKHKRYEKFENMDDDTLNELLGSVNEDIIRRFR